jgi:hypothetical protein
MICGLCRGSGSLFCKQSHGGFEHYECPACGGCGCRVQYGPATIQAHAFREKWGKKGLKYSDSPASIIPPTQGKSMGHEDSGRHPKEGSC